MTPSSLSLIRREPDKAYVCDMLWLPRSRVAEGPIKEALQLWVMEKGVAVLQTLWDETNTHIICPREFIPPSEYSRYDFPFIDLTPKKFKRTGVFAKINLRDNQREAYEHFSRATGGVLALSPGKGKTVLACKRIADLECPSLIVVHTTYLWEQWKERIKEFLDLPFGTRLGEIQGQTMDWEQPVTLAMIHTLAARADGKDLPVEFFRHFGAVFFDEVHHLAAPMFVKTAPLVQGLRYGLSGTPDRIDGKEFIYKYHIGPVFFSDLSHDLIPRIYFQLTPTYVDTRKNPPDEILDVTGEVNIPKLRSYMATRDDVLEFRANRIQEALDQNRKILAISHSKEMLKRLHEMIPSSGLVIQETPQAKRTEIVQKSRICFAIDRLGTEGLDDEMLDTLFVLTPFSSHNDLRQMMGRIQRAKPGKRTPVVVIFDDVNVGPFHGLCMSLRKTLKGWGMDFDTLATPKGTR